MRIAIITREYPPETAWGGIGSFYKELTLALAQSGHEVEVFAQGIHTERSEAIDGVQVHRVLARNRIVGEKSGGDLCGNHDLGEFAFALAQAFLESFLRRHHERPFDVVEGHEHLGVNALINLYAPAGIVTVTRYHTAYHSLVARNLVDWPKSERIFRLECTSVRHADYRIATSKFIDEVVRQDFGVLEPARVLANFAAPPKPMEHEALDRENLLVFAGRLVMDHKRPDLAALAFRDLSAEFPDWRIEFAGPDMVLPGGDSTWKICSGILAPVDPTRYCYHGVLDRAHMDHLYRRARILVVPSKFESFGMVAIEAMHRGCVPVVSDRTALTDATDDPTLEFSNGDLESLKATLHRLMADPALWAEKSRRGVHRAVNTFNHDYLLQQNLFFFSSALQTARRSLTVAKTEEALPVISIITPSYNQGPFIEETIVSILDQDYPRFEHVVMDGGSTDDTVRILQKYPHLRWRSEKDRGQTHAINKGLLETTGEIAAYLNSDDVYRAGTFHAVARFFRDNPDADIMVGHCDVIDAKSQITGHHVAKAGDLGVLVQYWEWDRLHCIPQQSVFFRRRLLTEIGLFDERFQMVMDYEFWLRTVASGRAIHVLDRTLAAFRIVPTTKTGGRTDEMYLEEYLASSEYRRRLPFKARFRAMLGARRQVARKLVDLAEHLVLSTPQGYRPFRLVRMAIAYNPALLLAPRCLYSLAGAITKGPNPVFARIERMHRKHLNRLWLRSQRATNL